jgi:tetratricopeptide (TPR) repeat protein
MKATFRTCPQCQARNKLTWEFCARCGESLEFDQAELEADNAESETSFAEEYDEEAEAPPASGSTLLRDVVVLAGLVVGAMVSWEWFRSGPTASAVASGFVTAATLPVRSAPVAAVVDPRAGEDDFEQGRALLSRGDAAGALPLLARAVELAPENASYRSVYADALIATGAVTEGLAQYESAARIDPANSAVASAFARALYRAERYAEAVSAYEAAVALSPNDRTLQRELSDLYSRTGQADRSLALATQAAAGSNDLVVEQQLGRAQEAAGNLEEAAATYRRILTRMPEAHLTRGLLAEIAFKQGKPDEALAIFREGLAVNASAPLLHRGLGSLLERSGRTAEAAAAYREYARLSPTAPDSASLQERAGLLEQSLSTQ